MAPARAVHHEGKHEVLVHAVISVSKILKIKKIVSAAGGVTKAATRVIKALGARGSMSDKAKAGFKDLGTAVVAAAVVVLDIDQIQDQCG